MLLKNYVWTALNLLASYLSLENCRACKKAVNNLSPLQSPQSICMQCWMKLLKLCAGGQIKTKNVYAAGAHVDLLRKLIIKLKQTEDPMLAYDLANLLLKNSKLLACRQTVQLIIPMPLHKQRLRNRGFNQSELLAFALSSLFKLPYSAAALKRIRDTRSQRGLHRDERWANMQGTFEAASKLVKGKSIFLVDDVCTSGATMQSAVEALLNAGAANVIGVCIAIAPLMRESSSRLSGQKHSF